MSVHKTIFKNTFYQLFSKALTSLIGLATRKLLTNYLGPAGFGDYVFLLTYSTLFGSLADWGTITISVREASQHQHERPQIFGTALIGRLLLSLFACLIALLLSPFIIKNTFTLPLVIVTSFLIIVMAVKASFGIIFETLLQMHRWVYIDVTASLFTLLFYFFAVSLHLPLFYFFLFLILSTLLACLVGLILALKVTPLDFHLHPALLTHLAKESFPMGLSLIMFSIYNRIDTLILGIFRPASEIGFYGLAYFIYENLVLVAAYTLNSVYPFLSAAAVAKTSHSFKNISRQYYFLMLGMGFFAFLGCYLLSPLFVYVISSPAFAAAIPLLQILAFSLFFSFLNHATGYSLIAAGKQRLYSFITLAALIFNVTANFLFIPHYGAISSAWITVCTEGLVQILSLFLLYHSVKSLRG